MSNDIIYSWSFSNDKNRWSMWYIIALAIIIWFVVWWFLSRQYIFGALIILITWVYFFVENNSQDNVEVSISNLWVKVNNFFYDFSKIESYSIIYNWDVAVILRLSLIKRWLKNLDLQIDNNTALDLKSILPNYIKEDEKAELSFNDKLIKILKL